MYSCWGGGVSIGPRHSVPNPSKYLHIGFGNTTANGIAIVKSAGDYSIGKREDGSRAEFGTRFPIPRISLIYNGQ